MDNNSVVDDAKTRAVIRSVLDELRIDPPAVMAQLIAFVRDETQQAGKRTVVIGLSGGLDSAASAFVAVEALGKENVIGYCLPYRTTAAIACEDASLAASTLGIESVTVDITPIVDAYLEMFPDSDDKRMGNVMARTRMIVLYDRSAVHDALVLGTGNKTEELLGYTTLWGDMACGINPLGDLYKTQVRQLAAALGVPKRIIDKTPSADLWEGQTDEGELGITYGEADAILHLMVDNEMTREQVVEMGFKAGAVRKVDGLVRANEFKRRMPKVAKLAPTR